MRYQITTSIRLRYQVTTQMRLRYLDVVTWNLIPLNDVPWPASYVAGRPKVGYQLQSASSIRIAIQCRETYRQYSANLNILYYNRTVAESLKVSTEIVAAMCIATYFCIPMIEPSGPRGVAGQPEWLSCMISSQDKNLHLDLHREPKVLIVSIYMCNNRLAMAFDLCYTEMNMYMRMKRLNIILQ